MERGHPQRVVVGQPARGKLWILSRTPQMDEETYQQLLNRIAALGYDPTQIVPTPQPES